MTTRAQKSRGSLASPIHLAVLAMLALLVSSSPALADAGQTLIERCTHGESLAGRRMRKMGIKYSRFHPESVQVKRDFIEVHSLRDWTRVLDQWYTQDGPGVWPAADAADEVNDGQAVDCGVGA